MHRRISLWVVVLGLLVGADAAMAASAEFQGFCTNSTTGGGTLQTACKLTVLRHPDYAPPTDCGFMGISSTSWDFGDGTTGTSPGTINHTYTGVVGLTISVTVTCVDGSTASASHCLYNNIGVGGCIRPGAGWTP